MNKKFARDAEFLAAVIMIQRNFKARKARREADAKRKEGK